MTNCFSLLLVMVISLKAFSCDDASFSLINQTDNSDGTYTYEVELCLEMLGLEGIPDWFQLEFSGGTFSNVISYTPGSVFTTGGDEYIGSLVNGNNAVRWQVQGIFPTHNTNSFCNTFSITTQGQASSILINYHDTYPSGCTETYNLPVPSACEILDLSATVMNCNIDNTYDVEITVEYINPPAIGNLIVYGLSFAFPITSSPQTITLTGLIPDGQDVDVTAFFSDDVTCTYTENALFTAPSIPLLQITNPDPVCAPETIDLTSNEITSGSSNTGTFSYWTDPDANTSLSNETTIDVSGTYFIVNNNNGCTDTAAVDVIINDIPVFNISGIDPSECNFTDGTITISGLLPSSNYGLAYDSLSIASNPEIITSDISGNIILNGFQAGIYSDFTITLGECTFTSPESIDLENPGAPSIDLKLDTSVCDVFILENITGSNLSGNVSYYTESQGNGAPLGIGDPINSTQLIYIYDIIGECEDEISYLITVTATPNILNVFSTTSLIVCEENPLYELPEIEGYELSGNENYYDNSQVNNGLPLSFPLTTSQVIYIYDENEGCADEESFDFKIINCEFVIPTAFTPDNDQINDFWQLEELDAIWPNNIVYVYNRWGNKIYESIEGNYSGKPWNGTYNGSVLPVGSYYYTIELSSNPVLVRRTGTVSIIK